MPNRQIVFRALNSGPANALVSRLMDSGISVDRVPEPGYIAVTATGVDGDFSVEDATSGLAVTVVSDETV